MRIQVHLYATLRRYAPAGAGGVLTLDVPEGSKAEDAIAKAAVDAAEVRILLINGVSGPPDRMLGEGDRLGLFPAVGGG